MGFRALFVILGDSRVTVRHLSFGGVDFGPGHYLNADADGVVVAAQALVA